jgi:hypothetical protein
MSAHLLSLLELQEVWHIISHLSCPQMMMMMMMMMMKWAAETHFVKLPKYVCRVVNTSGFLGFLWMHCNSWILVPLVEKTLIVLAIWFVQSGGSSVRKFSQFGYKQDMKA